MAQRSKAIYLYGMSEKFLAEWQFAGTYAHSHWRKTIQL